MKRNQRSYNERRHDVLRLILQPSAIDDVFPPSDREIAHRCAVSKTTVRRLRHTLIQKDLAWSDVEPMTDAERDGVLNKPAFTGQRKRHPDWAAVAREMKGKNVTLQLLWAEYSALNPSTALSYSHFAACYVRYKDRSSLVMRQAHRPGDDVQVDYAGGGLTYINDQGQHIEAQLFVAALPASGLIFATATPTQNVGDFIEAHERMFAFFGGVTFAVVPDNLKSAHSRGYQDYCQHLNVQFKPTRVRRPKDKPTVENSVRQVKTQILARLRHQVFHSLEAINDAFAEGLEQLNARPMVKDGVSRRARFEATERHCLRPLPDQPYVFREFLELPKVPSDYHVKVHGHFYSVPHTRVGQVLHARVSPSHVEIVHEREVIALHARGVSDGSHTTDPVHMPAHHRAQAQRTPEGIRAWAKSVGGAIEGVVAHHFGSSQHLIALATAEKLKKLSRQYGADQLQTACAHAIAMQTPSITTIERFLRAGTAA